MTEVQNKPRSKMLPRLLLLLGILLAFILGWVARSGMTYINDDNAATPARQEVASASRPGMSASPSVSDSSETIAADNFNDYLASIPEWERPEAIRKKEAEQRKVQLYREAQRLKELGVDGQAREWVDKAGPKCMDFYGTKLVSCI